MRERDSLHLPSAWRPVAETPRESGFYLVRKNMMEILVVWYDADKAMWETGVQFNEWSYYPK